MAINYYRTVLGVGVSLMTMQLIIGIGVQYLKDLVAASGQNLDAPTLAIIMIASIILAVIAHRLPQMVAGMVVGGGHNGAIGGVGIMTLLGTGVALSSMAGSAATAASTAGASTAAAESHKLLLERIASAEAAIAAGSGNVNNFSTPTTRPDSNAGHAGLTGPPGRNPTATDTGTGPGKNPRVANMGATSAPNTAGGASSAAGKRTSTGPAPAGPPEVDEPPLTRPISPDEQRGFPRPPDWIG